MTRTFTWIDVTYPITPLMVVWPGQPKTERERVSSLDEGKESNVSVLRMSMHTGTHMDAPLHFFADGDDITHAPLDVAIGPVRVAQIAGDAVTPTELGAYERRNGPLRAGERLLFRTANSSRDWLTAPFDENYVALRSDAASYLVDKGLILVGVDYLSVAPFINAVDTHRILLGAGVWVLEGLDLRRVEEGSYEMVALPLKLEGSDASPVRVLLRPGAQRSRAVAEEH